MNRNRLFKLGLILIFTILLGYYISSSVTLNGFKDKIILRVASETGLTLKIFGDIKIALLPRIAIVINQSRLDVDQKNQIEIPKIEANLKLTSLLLGKISVDGLAITGAQFSKDIIDDILQNNNTAITNTVLTDNILKNISFNNVDLVIYPTSNLLNKLNKVNGKLEYISKNLLKFSGSFKLNGFDHFLKADIKLNDSDKSKISKIALSNDFAKLDFTGVVSSNMQNIDGKISLDLFSKDNDDTRFNIFSNAILQSGANINTDIKINSDELLLINLKLSSNYISNFSGEVRYNFNNEQSLQSDITIDSINFDKAAIKNNKNDLKDTSLEKFVKDFLVAFNFDIPDDLRGNVNFKLKEIVYNNKKVNDVNLTSHFIDKKIVFDTITLNLPGSSTLTLKGDFTHNQIRPKFEGEIELAILDIDSFNKWLNLNFIKTDDKTYKIINLAAKINIIPRNIWLSDLTINWNQLNASGKVSVKHTGQRALSITSELNIDQLNSDDTEFVKSFDNFIGQLYAYDYDRSGDKFYQITNDFNWLRNFPIHLDSDLTIDKFIFKGMNFSNFVLNTTTSSNNFIVRNIQFDHPDASLNANLSLITSSIAPNITTNFNISYLTQDFIEKVMPTKDYLIAYQSQAVKLDPENTQSVIIGGANFFNLNSVTGNVKLKAKSLKFQDLLLKNVNIEASAQDGLISIPEINVDLFNGNLQSATNIAIYSLIPSYSVAFAYNNFMLKDFLNYYGGYNSLDGYASMNGNVITKGPDVDSLYANIAAQINFLGKRVVWNGFNIGEIVNLSEYKATLIEKSNKLELYSKSGQSLFDNLEGKIVIDQGLASLEDFKFSNNRVAGAFAGKLDVKNRLISSFTRINFIPIDRASIMSIDITDSSSLSDDSKAKVNYSNYLNFLKNDRSNLYIKNDTNKEMILRNYSFE